MNVQHKSIKQAMNLLQVPHLEVVQRKAIGSEFSNNSAGNGNNNAVIDAGSLGNNPNGVQYVTDGSCQ